MKSLWLEGENFDDVSPFMELYIHISYNMLCHLLYTLFIQCAGITPSGLAVAGSNPGSRKEGSKCWSTGKSPAPNSVPYVPWHIDGRLKDVKLNRGW